MPRDHMLGWPPALLALDPADFPRKVERTTHQPRLTDREQELRRGVDKLCTSQLEAPKAAPTAKPQAEAPTAFVPEYFKHLKGDMLYRTTPGGPGAMAEKFKDNAWKLCNYVPNSDLRHVHCYTPIPDPTKPTPVATPVDDGYTYYDRGENGRQTRFYREKGGKFEYWTRGGKTWVWSKYSNWPKHDLPSVFPPDTVLKFKPEGVD